MPKTSDELPAIAIYVDCLMLLISVSLIECFWFLQWISRVDFTVPKPMWWYFVVEKIGRFASLGSRGQQSRRNYLTVYERCFVIATLERLELTTAQIQIDLLRHESEEMKRHLNDHYLRKLIETAQRWSNTQSNRDCKTNKVDASSHRNDNISRIICDSPLSPLYSRLDNRSRSPIAVIHSPTEQDLFCSLCGTKCDGNHGNKMAGKHSPLPGQTNQQGLDFNKLRNSPDSGVHDHQRQPKEPSIADSSQSLMIDFNEQVAHLKEIARLLEKFDVRQWRRDLRRDCRLVWITFMGVLDQGIALILFIFTLSLPIVLLQTNSGKSPLDFSDDDESSNVITVGDTGRTSENYSDTMI